MSQTSTRIRRDREKRTPLPRIASEQLFADGKRIEIEHRGEIYRLQITRQGKLILTK